MITLVRDEPIQNADAAGELVTELLKHEHCEYVDGPSHFDDMRVWEVWTLHEEDFRTAQVTEKTLNGKYTITVYESFLEFIIEFDRHYSVNASKLASRVTLIYKLTSIILGALTVCMAIYLVVRNEGTIRPEIISTLIMGLVPAAAIYFLGQWGANTKSVGV